MQQLPYSHWLMLIALGFGVAILVLLFAAGVQKKWNINLRFPRGFVGFGGPSRKPRSITEAEFRKVLDQFIPGDAFDMLHVARDEDEYGGIMLMIEDGFPTLDVDFQTHAEAGRIAAFQSMMRAEGYDGEVNSECFNGGSDEEHRITTFQFLLPSSAEEVLRTVRLVLDHLHANGHDRFFVSASRFSDGPGLGLGFLVRRSRDPLDEVLGPAP